MPFQESLSPELIIAAYRGGYFPMPDPDTGEILWFNPDPRAIIPLDAFHVSHSLRRKARRNIFQVTVNKDFVGVMGACADRPSTWISSDIKKSYTALHHLGFCHSIEVWNVHGDLVGGLYGLSQGGVFNAESMFSRETDASKIALWALVSLLNDSGIRLLEVQFMTDHLRRMGAVEIPREVYLRRLGQAIQAQVAFKAPTGVYNWL